jgi:hypothetical protein
MPSPATGRSPLPRRHRRRRRAAATVTVHAPTTLWPGARGRLYGKSLSASRAFAHPHSLHTHDHTHTYLPHRILLRPTRGSAQSARRGGGGGGGEATQPDTAHDAIRPEDASTHDESEAQANLLNPEPACLVVIEPACEPSRVDGPDRSGPSLSAQK